MVISGFLIQCVYFGLAYLAMKRGLGAGMTAIIMALQPALVAALSPLVGEKRGRSIMRFCLALGFTGVGLSVMDATMSHAAPFSASLLALGALLGITIATLLEKKRHGMRTDPILGGVVQYIFAALILWPAALSLESQHIIWHPNLVIAFGYLVIANSLIAVTLYVALIQRGDATRVSAVLYLVTPLALLLAWLILGELISWHAIAVFFVFAGGLYRQPLKR